MTATQTVGTPEYFVVTGTIAGIVAFNAAVEVKINAGYAPIGIPYTDGVNIEQVMFRGVVASFIAQYAILALPGASLAGYQVVDTGGGHVGADPTGLMNDPTVYTASVVVDGGAPQLIDVTGSAAQDYTTLITELQTDTVGATWALVGGDLRLTSNTTGVTSTIAITDVDLFATITGFVTINAAVPGTNTSPDSFQVDGNQAADFQSGYRFTVSGSTGNDGVYTVYPTGPIVIGGPLTNIPVVETVPDSTPDGFIVAYAPSVGP